MFDVDFHILNQKATPAIYADTLANRPAASFAGRLFVNTASPYGVYRDTGSAWVQIASNGGGTSTGINGLNGTTNIGLGGTLANNTTIAGANFNLLFNGMTNFQSASKNFVFQANSASNGISYISGGNDLLYLQQINNNTGVNSNLYFTSNTIKTIFTGGNYGLNLDDTTGKFVIGDYNNDRKYNSFVVNDDTDRFYITTQYNQANTDQDLFYVSNNSGANERFVKLGDFNNYTNGVSFVIDDIGEIYSTYAGGVEGLNLNFNDGEYIIGSGATYIKSKNTGSEITLLASNILLNVTPEINNATITNTATATFPQQFLSIVINGVNKKIQIYNP